MALWQPARSTLRSHTTPHRENGPLFCRSMGKTVLGFLWLNFFFLDVTLFGNARYVQKKNFGEAKLCRKMCLAQARCIEYSGFKAGEVCICGNPLLLLRIGMNLWRARSISSFSRRFRTEWRRWEPLSQRRAKSGRASLPSFVQRRYTG